MDEGSRRSSPGQPGLSITDPFTGSAESNLDLPTRPAQPKRQRSPRRRRYLGRLPGSSPSRDEMPFPGSIWREKERDSQEKDTNKEKARSVGKRESFVEEDLDVEARQQEVIDSFHRAARGRSGPLDGRTVLVKRSGAPSPRNFQERKASGPMWNVHWDDMVSKPVATDWKYVVDNDFARGYVRLVSLPRPKSQSDSASTTAKDSMLGPKLPPDPSEPPCPALSLITQEPGDGIEVSRLLETSGSCSLCEFIFRSASDRMATEQDQPVTISRDGSILRLGKSGPSILTLCACPGSTSIPQDIQIGLPTLLGPRDPARFELFREWLRSCDKTCKCRLGSSQLPTRVLDVGTLDKPGSVSIHCPNPGETGKYVTLSHRWLGGDDFSTYQCNIDARFKGIDFAELPVKFKDAVTVTRELGIQYLWIDSICIIQKHEGCSKFSKCSGDWLAEFPKMEAYYGSAYCTIAATSATVPRSGFLDHRGERLWKEVPVTSGGPLYVCRNIDSFYDHVEKAELNKRGWVFQERALSRRILHFTPTQTYWECGGAVRCETLTRMTNERSGFMSDPQFPKYILKYHERSRIQLLQHLFKRYTRLHLTKLADRPRAIAGLEIRLATTFKTESICGVMLEYSHRGLLWLRASSQEWMKSIDFQSPKEMESIDPPKIPSWSWMAYEGKIKYWEIPFEEVEWNEEIAFFTIVDEKKRPQWWELRGPVREFSLKTNEGEKQCLTFDTGIWDLEGLRCLVVGRLAVEVEEQTEFDYEYAVLVLASLEDEDEGCPRYKRIGIALLGSNEISLEGEAVYGHIL